MECFQHFCDARHLFLLINQLIDKNIYLTSLSPIETLHTDMGKNIGLFQTLNTKITVKPLKLFKDLEPLSSVGLFFKGKMCVFLEN